MNKPGIYLLPSDKAVLVIGESHTAYGVNDTLLDLAANLSQPGDAYLYTYAKLRKVLPLNPNIRTVVLSVSEQDITQRLISLWMRNDNFMSEKIRNFAHLISPAELTHLFLQNPQEVIKDITSFPKSKSTICYKIIRGQKTTMDDLKLGSYEVVKENIVQVKNKEIKEDNNPKALATKKDIERMYQEDAMTTSPWQIEYLHKIVDLCHSKNVKIIFLRTPEHKDWVSQNEEIFMNLLHTQFKEVPFIDYRNMPFPDTCYTDLVHLNDKGARIFSDSLNRYFKTRQ